jgi:hypothetical protein
MVSSACSRSMASYRGSADTRVHTFGRTLTDYRLTVKGRVYSQIMAVRHRSTGAVERQRGIECQLDCMAEKIKADELRLFSRLGAKSRGAEDALDVIIDTACKWFDVRARHLIRLVDALLSPASFEAQLDRFLQKQLEVIAALLQEGWPTEADLALVYVKSQLIARKYNWAAKAFRMGREAARH